VAITSTRGEIVPLIINCILKDKGFYSTFSHILLFILVVFFINFFNKQLFVLIFFLLNCHTLMTYIASLAG